MQRKSILIPFFVLGFVAFVFGSDWTQWRGPYRTGISDETGWSPEALNGAPNILWQTNLGVGHSAVCVKGDRLYALGNKEVILDADTLNIDIVHCLNAKNGREIWRYEFPCEDKNFPGPNTSPVIDEDRLYTLSWMGELYCFDAEKGTVRWKRHLIADSLTLNNEWGLSGSPVIVDDMLLLTAGKSGLALDKLKGSVVWKSELEVPGLTTPILYTDGEKQLALISSHDDIHAVDIHTGQRLWSYTWKTCNDPYVVNDKILLTANHNRKRTTLIEMNNGEITPVWESRVIAGWSFQNQVVIDNHSYAIANLRRGRMIQCVDLKTGELKWSHDHGGEGAMIAADGKLIIMENDGDLVVARVDPEKYSEISRAKVLQPRDSQGIPQDRRWACWTLPVLANGRVYVRSNWGDLVCVDVR